MDLHWIYREVSYDLRSHAGMMILTERLKKHWFMGWGRISSVHCVVVLHVYGISLRLRTFEQ